MNIQPTSQNNPNFEKLYAPKKLKFQVGRVSKEQLLKMPAIRDNIKRFDIFFKSDAKHDLGPNQDIHDVLGCAPWIGMVAVGALTFYMTKNAVLSVLSTFGSGLLGGIGFVAFNVLEPVRQVCFDYQIFGQKKYSDGTEIKTQPALCRNAYDVDFPLNTIINQLESEDKLVFLQTVAQNYPKNGVFDAKSILKILESENIKKDFANGEAFNYKIDVNGQDSLLTKFSELSKTEADTKEYDKIISIIKSTPNVDFHQKDAAGISILENILNMENSKALELVKDIEFEHTDYLDSLFNNIQDENFKAQAKKLKIKFKDPVEVFQNTRKLKDFEDAALVQLNSPFCDAHKVGFDLWKRVFVLCQNQKDILSVVNRILYNYLPENLRMDV